MLHIGCPLHFYYRVKSFYSTGGISSPPRLEGTAQNLTLCPYPPHFSVALNLQKKGHLLKYLVIHLQRCLVMDLKHIADINSPAEKEIGSPALTQIVGVDASVSLPVAELHLILGSSLINRNFKSQSR